MTDDRFSPAPDDEMLSAYLLGDLGDDEVRAFEQRLATEPALAAQLDALAAALVTMGGHDEAVVPEGFEQRLDARLQAARDETAPVVSLADARATRARSRGWWTAVGTAAAVVALGAVMASGALRGVGGGDDAEESAALDAADAPVALEDDGGGDDAAAGLEEGVRAEAGASGEADMDTAQAPSRPTAPVLFDDQVVITDEAELAQRYGTATEVTGLLGLPVSQAGPVAGSFTTGVQRAEPFAGGGAPGQCLDTVTTAAEQPLIPARVETVRYDGQAALAYVMVTASPDAAELDRVEIWVVAADDCSTLVFRQL